jgi:polar amino acid transport system substrate-binding protein
MFPNKNQFFKHPFEYMKHLRKLFYLIVLTLTIVQAYMLATPSCVVALPENKTIIMFIPDTDWPPYLINDPKYPGGGVLVEVLKAVAEPLGYTIITKRLPNKRGWMLLYAGDIDAHAKAKEWIDNPDDYLWTDIFLMNEDVLLLPADSDLQYTNPEGLHGKTVAAIEGFGYPALEASFSQKKIKRTNVASPFAMLDLLDRGRVDAALVNKSGTQWLFKNRPDLKPERFRLDEKPFDSAGYRYVFNKKNGWDSFIKIFNKKLKDMKKNGTLKAILDQYR